jgi:heme-degrading monooxygenase HmoA
MFIAMNRFRVITGEEAVFEQLWLSRDRRLDEMAGFVEFHLLRGPEREDHTLDASHTIWASHEEFAAWRQ